MTSKKRVVLITGAESGIGKSTSKIFLDNGYKVICTYLKNNNNKNTKDIEYHRIDITKSKDWENLALYIKKKFKYKHAVVTTNGTTALHLALLALDIKKNDEVIVPNLTYVAPVNAVSYTGAKPILVDVDSGTWLINEKNIKV